MFQLMCSPCGFSVITLGFLIINPLLIIFLLGFNLARVRACSLLFLGWVRPTCSLLLLPNGTHLHPIQCRSAAPAGLVHPSTPCQFAVNLPAGDILLLERSLFVLLFLTSVTVHYHSLISLKSLILCVFFHPPSTRLFTTVANNLNSCLAHEILIPHLFPSWHRGSVTSVD